MKNQLILKPRKFKILSANVVQDVEIAEIIKPRKFGSLVHVEADSRLEKYIGQEVFGNVDMNYSTPIFLFAD